jgi:hypothetical protein
MAVKTVKKEVPDEIYTHETGDRRLKVYREQHPVSPRSWDNYGVMMCQHKRYNLGDKEPENKERHSSWNDVRQEIKENHDVEMIMPLYLYDHSGISISNEPFGNRWDSGQVGFIYVTKSRLDELGLDEEKRTEEQLRKILEGEVETYNQYLNDQVWRYVYEEKETGEDGTTEWIEKDSCGGFFGDYREGIFEYAGENQEEYEKTGGER